MYRGRLAPSPTGLLHLGHARTFWIAQQRARRQAGRLILRLEDLDSGRCTPEYAQGILDDLRWFGFQWHEGPDTGGASGPYKQSQRHDLYRRALEKLRVAGWIYPCACSRQDVIRALAAPHSGEEEPIYPGTCRPRAILPTVTESQTRPKVNWRFRVPEGEILSFIDGHSGPQEFVAGTDFGDFVIWRHDHVPSYQLAVVVDDAAMQVTEVVRGADLLLSTARQILVYRALALPVPRFYHCPLVADENGNRLAKRHDALSLRTLREQRTSPEALRASWVLPV